jgi:hypothetical protein
MRARVPTLAVSIALLLGTGCLPDKTKDPDLLKAPDTWNVKGDELTFGAKNLEAFNSMSFDERQAHAESLMGSPGSFKGQARFQSATELGDKMDDRALGKYDAYATVEDPVLFEITITYHLFAEEKLGHGFPPGTYIEFTGTLADLVYTDETKPRKLELKVKDVSITRLDG